MNIKILIITIVLIGIGIGGFFIWKNGSAPETEKTMTEKEKTEKEIYIYKGIWLPTIGFQDANHLALNVQKLKDIGINTIFIQASLPFPDSWFERAKQIFPPELLKKFEEILPNEKDIIINIIQTAHENDLRVALTLGLNPAPRLEDVNLESWNSKIVEYAKLAEEYGVDLFAPMNEPGVVFGSNTGKWRQEILPKIKKVYHGEVVWKGAGPDLPDKTAISKIAKQPPGDFSGYDYIGFSSFYVSEKSLEPEEQLQYADRLTLEGYSQYVEGALDYMLALAKRDDSKGVIITEFGVLDKDSLSKEEIARAHEIVVEKGKDRAVGFFALDFLEVNIPGVPLVQEDKKIEEVLKIWFTEILK